jgi:hypothetical protein
LTDIGVAHPTPTSAVSKPVESQTGAGALLDIIHPLPHFGASLASVLPTRLGFFWRLGFFGASVFFGASFFLTEL